MSLRIAGAGLASFLALGVPVDGSGGVSAGGPAYLNPATLRGFSTLPAGWPGPAPELGNALETDIWSTVHAACLRHGIVEEAVTMFLVLWEESRLTPGVTSPCGRYFGIGQFTRSTFRHNVEVMKRLGLIWGEEEWSPYEPSQAIEVMAWMWSQGYHDHWGPYRRVVRKLASARTSSRLN